jgi:lipoate-protein ligase A
MQYQKTTWRVIEHPEGQGAWNMAVDEAILESVYSGKSLPTLRLYAWNPPCLSLGYAQPFTDVDVSTLNKNGWTLVRRPTGGRAILHTDELTYAVIAPETEPRVTGGVIESYLRLSQALLEALRLLDLSPQSQEKSGLNHENRSNPVCFEIPSNYEITVNAKKLIGSAQARRKKGVLQHGSLPMYGDLARILDALKFTSQDQRNKAKLRLLDHATTLEVESGNHVNWQQASDAVKQGFRSILNLDLQPGELTEEEINRAQSLTQEKYAHPSWTERI